jgi:hypothetical protein
LARENFICNLRRGKSERASQDFGPRVGLSIEQIECAAPHNAQSVRKSDSNLHC